MNVADSNHVAAELERLGMRPVEDMDDADVVVLNTCVVRQSAENKAVGKLGSLKPWRDAQPDRTLALMGCMVGVKPSDRLRQAYPQVDVFMAPSDPSPLVGHLRRDEITAESAEIELLLHEDSTIRRMSPASMRDTFANQQSRAAPGQERRDACRCLRAGCLWLQPCLHLLHHPLPPRRGAQPPCR